MDVREKLVELLFNVPGYVIGTEGLADHLIAHGVTVQEWISGEQLPEEPGYYLCHVLYEDGYCGQGAPCSLLLRGRQKGLVGGTNRCCHPLDAPAPTAERRMTMRLIDADALLGSHWWDSLTNEFDKARAKIVVMSAPAVDAVEVVRCKDCEHCFHLSAVHQDDISCSYFLIDYGITPDHFCSYGERRSGNE